MKPLIGLKSEFHHEITLFGTEKITETFRVCVNYCFTKLMKSNGHSIVIVVPKYQVDENIPVVLYNERLEQISSVNYFKYVDKLTESSNLIGNFCQIYIM